MNIATGTVKITTEKYGSASERERRDDLAVYMNAWPGPDQQKLRNLGLFNNRINLMRILYMQDLYRQILHVHGHVMEFGCRWGQNLCLFLNFRGIYEPYNMNRLVVGFDTFTGFPSVDPKDTEFSDNPTAAVGEYAVTEGYVPYLEGLLDYHASESHAAHHKRHMIVEGDVLETVPQFLDDRPETIIALAYFDMDIYRPTRDCLEAIKPHLTKGSIIAFDEPNNRDFPGETIALQEMLGSVNVRLCNSPYGAGAAYLIVE